MFSCTYINKKLILWGLMCSLAPVTVTLPKEDDTDLLCFEELLPYVSNNINTLDSAETIELGDDEDILYYALVIAAKKGDVLQLRSAIALQADIGEDYEAALEAAYEGRIDILFRLLRAYEFPSEILGKLTFMAASKGRLEALQFLIERGCPLTFEDKPILRAAAAYKQRHIVQHLLDLSLQPGQRAYTVDEIKDVLRVIRSLAKTRTPDTEIVQDLKIYGKKISSNTQ